MTSPVRTILVVVSVALASSCFAQESPTSLTKGEYKCRRTFAKEISQLATEHAACLSECFTEPSRSCGGFPDAQTAACIDAARTKAKSAVLRDCGGFDCPECYGGGQSCEAFTDSEFFQAANVTGLAVEAVYCDDSFSSDGLTAGERKCQDGLVTAAFRFNQGVHRCFDRCDRARRRGDPASCATQALDSPGFNQRAQVCVDRARDKFLLQCGDRCADRPDCLAFDCSSTLGLLEETLVPFSDDAYCVDEPPPVCGDGRVSSTEVCDATAEPSGCPAGLSCLVCFICVPECGDGVVQPTEQCDYNAVPSGCGATDFCNFDCTCGPLPVCGDHAITGFEACDDSAVPSGCAPGFSCVDCQFCALPCGNGLIDTGEICDVGVGCLADQACNSTCTACDPCPSATAIPADGGTFSGSTSAGGGFIAGTCGGESAPQQTFEWTPTASGLATISTCGSSFDTVLYIREGGCGGPQLACNDDSCAVGSVIRPLVSAGTTYTIVVDGFGADSGSFTLTVVPPGTAGPTCTGSAGDDCGSCFAGCAERATDATLLCVDPTGCDTFGCTASDQCSGGSECIEIPPQFGSGTLCCPACPF